MTASYSRPGNQEMLQLPSLLAISISQSLFLGHAQVSFDYPTHNIVFLDLQGPCVDEPKTSMAMATPTQNEIG